MKNIKMEMNKRLIKYICDNFNQQITTIDKYISDNAEIIVDALNINIDINEFIEIYADSNSQYYYNFVKLLQNHIDNNLLSNKIEVIYIQPYYYITKTEYGVSIDIRKRKSLADKLNILNELEDKIKGRVYEKFCGLFLKDMGLDTKITKNNYDDGIDIIAIFDITGGNFLQTIGMKRFYIIAQVKCYNIKVGIPVIKKLIGDSLMLKFQENNNVFIGNEPIVLIVFSFSGFNSNAIKYARKYKIYLISNDTILDIISSSKKNIDNFKCINYIESFSKIFKRQ